MARTAQEGARKRQRLSRREPSPEEEPEDETSAPPVRRRKGNAAGSSRLPPDQLSRRQGRPAVDGQVEESEDLYARADPGLRRKAGGRKGRRRRDDDDDDDDEDEEIEDLEDEEGEGRREKGVDPVSKLVRLALAMEYQKKPIRRQDISEKVLGTQFKSEFATVFTEAQAALRHVFGFSMEELPAITEKVSLAQQRRQAAAEAQRGGQAAEKKSQKSGSKSWHLINVLPDIYRIPNVHDPTLPDDQTILGIGMVIVAIVYLSGRSLSENTLRRHLRKFGVEERIPVEGNRETGKMENIIANMIREGYLVKLKDEVVPGQEQSYTFVIGPRGRLELGKEGVMDAVKTIYKTVDGEIEEGLERKVNRAIGLDREENKAGENAPAERNGEGNGRAKGKAPARRGGRRRQDSDEEEEAEYSDDD